METQRNQYVGLVRPRVGCVSQRLYGEVYVTQLEVSVG